MPRARRCASSFVAVVIAVTKYPNKKTCMKITTLASALDARFVGTMSP